MKTIHSFMGMALCSFPVMAQQSPNFLIIQCDHLTQRVVGCIRCRPQLHSTYRPNCLPRCNICQLHTWDAPSAQPSRAALWSGLMPHQTNVRSNSAEHINPPLPDSIPTLGSLFTANGYEAVHFGKTHDMGSLRGSATRNRLPSPSPTPNFPSTMTAFWM